MFRSRKLIILSHILIWCVFLLFPILVLPIPSSFLENDKLQLFIYFIFGITSIIFYYLNYNVLIPRYLFKRKYVYFILLIICFILLTILIAKFLITLFFFENHFMSSGRPKLLGNYVFRYVVVFIIAFGIRLFQKMKQIETENLKSELVSLKSQINPHFLFNTLNGIYGLALINSDKTAESISKLSSMMRYALTENNTEKVTLENEIKYLTNYIELQKIRLTKTTTVDFTVSGNIKSKQIPPLLFINFIENAFKYGVSNELESKIEIQIFARDHSILLHVKNEKINKKYNLESYKIGLKNIKRRLELIFGNDYVLDIENTANTFLVNLTIKLR